MLDATLAARAVGVEAVYKDAREGAVRNLPQRVYLIAMGEDGVLYPTQKFVATSAAHVGQVAGFRSQAYRAALRLLPLNGDGLGTVPLTVALLPQAPGATPAEGALVVTGSVSTTTPFRLFVSGLPAAPFAVRAGESPSAILAKAADSLDVLGLPVRTLFAYGAATSAADVGNAGDGTIGTITVTPDAQPRPGAYRLVCTDQAADAGTFSVTDPLGAELPELTVGAAYTSGTGLAFTLSDGADDFEVGDAFTLTVEASSVRVISGWTGETANELTLRLEGGAHSGLTWTITQPTGGAVNPSVADALSQIGDVWETMLINGLNLADSTALDLYRDWGEGRWGATTKKPAVVFTHNPALTDQEAIAIPETRRSDRVNCAIPNPGSPTLGIESLARSVARIARLANNVPAHDYCLRRVDGILPGPDEDQWDLPARDRAVKGGSSTVEVRDNEVRISDVVTFYHPTGEEPPAYRHVVDIVKLQNVIYNADLLFGLPEWAGAPLVPDDDLVTEPTAKKPKQAKAALGAMLQNLGLAAIISDPKTSAKATQAWIDTANPKRLNIRCPIKLAGNTNIIDVTLEWAFYFGSAPVAG